jgi:ketosteroid isomerase-like protein
MTTTQATPAAAVRTLLSAVDAGDVGTIGTLLTDDVYFRFGNAKPTDSKAAFASAAQAFLGSLARIRHEIRGLWEVGDGTVVCVMDVHYQRRDGRELTLPCCNVFRVHDGLIHDYRIYMDVNPVTAP